MQLLRAFKRTFGISAARVAVRTHMPWYFRLLVFMALGAVVLGVGWVTYDFGMRFAGFRQGEANRALTMLNETIQRQQAELSALHAKLAASERMLQIERATYGDLAKQVKSLAEENAALREDVAFFQSLMPAGSKGGAIAINRFKLVPEVIPGEYRYRLLLVQTGQRIKEFQGSLQFVLNLQQDSRKVVLTLPGENASRAKEYQLNFKFFQRIEGTFKIAPGAVVQSLQVRVFENGSNAPKLAQTVDIS